MTDPSILWNYTYNMTGIVGVNVANETERWVGSVNEALGGVMFLGLLIAFGIILFVSIRSTHPNLSDTKSLMWSGLITTFTGVLLFIVDTGLGVKLIEWQYLLPVILITGLAALLDKMSKRY